MIIANCGTLQLDWERASMSDYFEALEAHNEASDPNHKREPNVSSDRSMLSRILKARKNG